MIITISTVRIVDNSGAKLTRVIRVLTTSKKTKVGDLAVVSLLKVKPRVIHKGKKGEQLKKGQIRLCLILSTKTKITRKDGTNLNLDKNLGILVTTKGKTLGSRFKLAFPRELRSSKWLKVITIAHALF